MSTVTSNPAHRSETSPDPQGTPAASGTPPRTATAAAWRIVAAREISVKLTNRGFLLSTLVTLALIVGAIGLQLYLADSMGKITVAVADQQAGRIAGQAEQLAVQADQDVEITVRQESSADQVREAVRSGDAEAGLLLEGGRWVLLGDTGQNDIAATWIGAAVQSKALAENAQAAGTSLTALSKGAEVEHVLLSADKTPEGAVRMTTYFFGFLFYLAAVLLGAALATSVVEEKQNRIVELIASSVPLRSLLVGKIVGSTLLALAQMALFCLVGIGGLVATGEQDFLADISSGLGWFLVFYVVGIAVLACLFAAAGALATRSEDIQSTTTPVNAITALVFIVGVTVTGNVREILSFIPLTSTVTMPARVLAGETAWWEPAAALGLSIAAAVLIVGVSSRVYRRALLQTDRKLSFRQAMKLTD
ncbi:ABC transporter permease [Streptomyces sp. AK04-3B]|uniref:ABC transporter permease n=1 Tax=Streptomyces sp. AK04-3B TaxID=3028650 RepID=UPI0029B01F35|nr:ABC transporter permease [Streptomyces sp. AK04-3B]MDX3798304.1 ABC transporter permease [Streptomyces sp. AK04-3B]